MGIVKGRVTYRFSYVMRHNDANKMTPTPYHMHHSQNFGKIKGGGVFKKGAGILHRLYRFSGGVKSWWKYDSSE